MRSFLYSFCLLFLGVPTLLFQRFIRKKYRGVLLQKIGITLPKNLLQKKKSPTFWIHAVSLGETKATRPWIKRLKSSFPNCTIILSTMTATGLQEAERIEEVDCSFYLPLDFSWVMRKLLSRFSPKAIFLIENDVWYHFLKIAKEHKTKLYWLSAKLSERSFRRYQLLPAYTKTLFSLFNHVFAQNSIYEERFKHFIEKNRLSIGGDLKFDATFTLLDFLEKNTWQSKLGISPEDFVITIACTHSPEEKKLLDSLTALLNQYPYVKILLAPRHPERFSEVERILKTYPFEHGCFSHSSSIEPHHRILLINTMGFLPICYQLSQIAIVGGSFIDKIGGHNILEPCQFHVPVFFGPYMDSQKALKEKVLSFRAGEMTSFDEIKNCLNTYLKNPHMLHEKKLHTQTLIKDLRGSVNKIWQEVFADRDVRAK